MSLTNPNRSSFDANTHYLVARGPVTQQTTLKVIIHHCSSCHYSLPITHAKVIHVIKHSTELKILKIGIISFSFHTPAHIRTYKYFPTPANLNHKFSPMCSKRYPRKYLFLKIKAQKTKQQCAQDGKKQKQK